MKLLELRPHFVELLNTFGTAWKLGNVIQNAHGLLFSCPACLRQLGNIDLVLHRVMVWQPKVSFVQRPVIGRWEFFGTGYHDLTLKAHAGDDNQGMGDHIYIAATPTTRCATFFRIENGEIKS